MQYEKLYETVKGLKRIDSFGQPIGLTYKGKASFETGFGGFCSLVIWLIIVWNLVEDVLNMHKDYTMISY